MVINRNYILFAQISMGKPFPLPNSLQVLNSNKDTYIYRMGSVISGTRFG